MKTPRELEDQQDHVKNLCNNSFNTLNGISRKTKIIDYNRNAFQIGRYMRGECNAMCADYVRTLVNEYAKSWWDPFAISNNIDKYFDFDVMKAITDRLTDYIEIEAQRPAPEKPLPRLRLRGQVGDQPVAVARRIDQPINMAPIQWNVGPWHVAPAIVDAINAHVAVPIAHPVIPHQPLNIQMEQALQQRVREVADLAEQVRQQVREAPNGDLIILDDPAVHAMMDPPVEEPLAAPLRPIAARAQEIAMGRARLIGPPGAQARAPRARPLIIGRGGVDRDGNDI